MIKKMKYKNKIVLVVVVAVLAAGFLVLYPKNFRLTLSFSNIFASGSAVTVVSPNGGEVFYQPDLGEPISRIKIVWKRNWMPKGAKKLVSIYYRKTTGPNQLSQPIAENIPDSDFAWEIPANLLGNDFKIVVTSNGSGGNINSPLSDESDGTFSILAKPPYVKVTYPNGGEILRKGNSYTVTWTSNIMSTDPAIVVLYRYDDPLNLGSPVVAEGYYFITKNTGSYTFSIPAGQPFKCVNNPCPLTSTKVKAFVNTVNMGLSQDYSDNYFSVLDPLFSPTPTPTPTPTSPPNNSTLNAERIFIGQFNNTKYSLTLNDPDGISEFLINKTGGGFMWGGSPKNGRPPCPTAIYNSPVTLDPSNFPLSGYVIDCINQNIKYNIQVSMPVLPIP